MRRGLLIYPVHAAVVQELIAIRNTDTMIQPVSVDLGKEDIEGLNQDGLRDRPALFGWLGADAA